MQRKLINSQLSNFKTYEMYKRQLLTLAENVFEFKNMPAFIDTAYLNKQLLRKGAIAFFKDELMGLFPVLRAGRRVGRCDHPLCHRKHRGAGSCDGYPPR